MKELWIFELAIRILCQNQTSMRYFTSSVLLLLLFYFLCPSWSLGQTGTISWDGKTRDFRFHLPTGYTPGNAYPLVLSMHGAGSDPLQQEFYSGFNDVADTGQFIICYPHGVNNLWNAGLSVPGASQEDDVGFLNALIDYLAANYSVDLSRVYACGISNGGFMSYRLACELPHRLAAIASVAGQMTRSVYAACNPPRPFPVMHLHGTLDLVVDYNGALDWISVDSTLDFWTANNNCQGAPAFSTFPDIAFEGSTVEAYHYANCDGDSEVLLYKILNGGHTWPGGPSFPFLGITNQDINGSAEIWKFFLRFQNLNAVGIAADSEEKPIRLSPNPGFGRYEVELPGQGPMQLSVQDLQGKEIWRESLPGGRRVSLDLGFAPQGIYLLKLQSDERVQVLRLVKLN